MDFKRWTRRVTPREGDLLFSYETRLGEAALMPAGTRACLGRRMALLRLTADDVCPRYLLYKWLSPEVKNLIHRHVIHGATVNRIALSTLGEWRLHLPSLPEQEAVANVLGALDDKIEVNRRLAATADELATAVVRSLPASDWVRLADVADVTMGSSPKGERLNEDGEGLPFYQGIRDFGLRYPSRRVFTTAPIRHAAAGDVLVSVRAPVGTLNLASEEMCIGRGVASLRPQDRRPYLLFHLLRGIPEVWAKYNAGGTVFGSINRSQLEDLEVPRPAGVVAEQFESRLRSLEGTLAAAVAETHTLGTLRDTLLPKLMSGDLRVREAEAAVAEAV
ncbi:restriction endonuclease subunit S [Pseudactinotalea sp. HY158]|uniref:restriction endonuclease subunit S n=1 Tax=Pseudactinotalea sp. HY158 TaxID=2654547 RepID=UPI003519FDC9